MSWNTRWNVKFLLTYYYWQKSVKQKECQYSWIFLGWIFRLRLQYIWLKLGQTVVSYDLKCLIRSLYQTNKWANKSWAWFVQDSSQNILPRMNYIVLIYAGFINYLREYSIIHVSLFRHIRKSTLSNKCKYCVNGL